MFRLFCNHSWKNIGIGYDDLWECSNCGKQTERDPEYRNSLFCSHEWVPMGGMDDYKNVSNAEKSLKVNLVTLHLGELWLEKKKKKSLA